MAVTYSLGTITSRLEAVVDSIDEGGNGSLVLLAGGTTVSTISLARPCGTVDSGVLTFDGTLLDPAAAATGTVDSAVIRNGSGTTVISGLSVGIPMDSDDILISNGMNSTVITAGQTVAVLSAQIVGS